MAEITPDDLGITTDFAVREHRSLWRDAWHRLLSNRTARLGLAIVLLFVLSAVLAHYFWDYDPKTDLDYSLKLKPPNLFPNEDVQSIHLFGTDKLGRDIFRRVVHGGWNSLRVGLVAVGISLLFGGILGLLAGFYESMLITPAERILLLALIGLLLGALSAWIAMQPIQVLLFALLGAASAYYDNFLAGKVWRVVLWGVLGTLIGVGLGSLKNPATGLVCGALGLIIGGILALPLGGKFFSDTVMRAMDVLLSFPSYLLAIAIVAFLGPGLEKGMIAIGVVGIPVYARLVRSAVLSVIQKEYILAAQSIGESHGRILFRGIFPNILSPVIVQSTMGLAGAILSAAALGFLGLGAIPPEPEWGAMLGDSYRFLASGAWWAVVFPGLAIMLSVLGFNLLGDGLRDALDPKLRI
ncbi:MAG: ABC transporter permease [Anaerolineales bacterium]|jgi:ABC-type dipeptide/oligopeptide/nickel transport system permease subunit